MPLFGVQLVLLLLTFASTNTFMFSKDCLVTPWSRWSQTDSSGKQTRIRRIMRVPSKGGKPCPELTEERDLNVDCQVSEWSSWDGNFGFGQQSRSRKITQHHKGTGEKCPEIEEYRFTNKTPTVVETAKNVETFFIRPSGMHHRVRRQAGPGSVRDLLLIMDSSGSIGYSRFITASKQISRLIGMLCPAEGPFDVNNADPYLHNQAAMLTFSSKVVQNFDFNDYVTTEEIQTAISGATYYGGSTNTAEAFRRAIGMFQPSKGARDDQNLVKREVLILTDGQSNSLVKTLAAVKNLHEVADVYGLMTGGHTIHGQKELTAYVSAPINEHLFYIENLRDLGSLVDYIEGMKNGAGEDWCAPFDIR